MNSKLPNLSIFPKLRFRTETSTPKFPSTFQKKLPAVRFDRSNIPQYDTRQSPRDLILSLLFHLIFVLIRQSRARFSFAEFIPRCNLKNLWQPWAHLPSYQSRQDENWCANEQRAKVCRGSNYPLTLLSVARGGVQWNSAALTDFLKAAKAFTSRDDAFMGDSRGRWDAFEAGVPPCRTAAIFLGTIGKVGNWFMVISRGEDNRLFSFLEAKTPIDSLGSDLEEIVTDDLPEQTYRDPALQRNGLSC